MNTVQYTNPDGEIVNVTLGDWVISGNDEVTLGDWATLDNVEVTLGDWATLDNVKNIQEQ